MRLSANLCAAALSVICAAAALSARAEIMAITQGPFSAGEGGEFTMTPSTVTISVLGDPIGANPLVTPISGPTSFQTFCLEHGETFQPGSSYIVAYNTAAVEGGISGGSDPLDARTAYLYTNFRMGTLTGYDYSLAGRQGSAGLLQEAIWILEEEIPATPNSFVDLATAAVGSGAWTGLGDVRVLNVTDQDGTRHQDQLTLITPGSDIPVPASSAVLAMTGLLAARRRR